MLIPSILSALAPVGERTPGFLAGVAPEVYAALIVGSTTILVSVWSVLWSSRSQQRQLIEQEQRKQKAVVYQELLVYWVIVMRGERRRSSASERKKMDQGYYRSVPPKMLAWASESVLKEYGLRASPLGEKEEDRSILDFEQLLFALRKDLGYSNKNLERGDLLRTFLLGVDEALNTEQQPPSAS